MKRICILLALVAFAQTVRAQVPAGYYDTAEGKSGEALRQALHDIIDNHNSLSYNGAKDELWETVDKFGGVITCIYTGRTTTSFNRDTDGMNAEHTWPQSRGAGSTPPRSDLHHLFVTDGGWNSRRGSLRFDNVSDPSNTSPIGAKQGSMAFEPPDEYKGDVARVIFYFHIRYLLPLMDDAFVSGSNDSTADNHMGELTTLAQWHFDDPPSDYERHRNEEIFDIQFNRNPFIDRPEFVTAIFNIGSTEPTVSTEILPVQPFPADTVQVSANITASPEVNPATVKTFWRVGTSGGFTEVAMTRISGSNTNGTWEMSSPIPAQAAGTRIEYYVEAGNDEGTTRDPGSGTDFYIVATPGAPVINGSTDPVMPRVGEAITLEAAITSDVAMNASTIRATYETPNGALASTAFTLQSGSSTDGTYNAVTPIVGFRTDEILQYYIEGEDTDGRMGRFPAAGFASVTISGAPSSIDVGGYIIEQENSSQSFTIPANTMIESGGTLIVARDTTEASFETAWGVTLPANCVYIDGGTVGNGLMPAINGSENYTLKSGPSTTLEGPTPDMSSGDNYQRNNAGGSASAAGSWDVTDSSTHTNASPGSFNGTTTSSGNVIISEYSDAPQFADEFIELFYDSPGTGNVDPPDAPANLTATAGADTISVSWDAVSAADFDGYYLYRGGTSGGQYTRIGTLLTGTSYVDNDVSESETYYYVVTSLAGSVESLNSLEAQATLGTGGVENHGFKLF